METAIDGKHIEVKQAGQKVLGLGKAGWRKTQEEPLFSEKEQEAAFNGRLALRESVLEVWNADTRQVLRICEDRQVWKRRKPHACRLTDRTIRGQVNRVSEGLVCSVFSYAC